MSDNSGTTRASKDDRNFIFHIVAAAALLLFHLRFLTLIRDVPVMGLVAMGINFAAHSILIYLMIAFFCSQASRIMRPHWRGCVSGVVITLFIAFYFLDFLLFTKIHLHLIRFVLQGFKSLKNFREMWISIKGCGVDIGSLAWIPILLLVSPLLGTVFYRWSARHRCSTLIGKGHILPIALCALSVLFVEELFGDKVIPMDVFRSQKSLIPIYFPLHSPPRGLLTLPAFVQSLPDEDHVRKTAILPNGSRKPNIFLVIIDSIRPDVVTKEIAPNLHQFLNENLTPSVTFAGANGTNPSFFGIFHAKHALYMTEYARRKFKLGSVPLSLIKQMGYNFHYFGSLPTWVHGQIFGEPNRLLNSQFVVEALHDKTNEFDRRTTDHAKALLGPDAPRSGMFVVYYITSSHWSYTWPATFPTLFNPYMRSFDLLRQDYTRGEGELLRNRYKNAVHYADSLFGEFINHLKERKLYEDAIIAVTSDHGEEFMEHELVGHGGHLCDLQLRVPMSFRFGKDRPVLWQRASTLDILPTILDYVGVRGEVFNSFDGVPLTHPGNEILISGALHQADILSFRNRKYTLFTEFDDNVTTQLRNIYIQKITDRAGKRLSFPDVHSMKSFIYAEFGESLGLRHEGHPARRWAQHSINH